MEVYKGHIYPMTFPEMHHACPMCSIKAFNICPMSVTLPQVSTMSSPCLPHADVLTASGFPAK